MAERFARRLPTFLVVTRMRSDEPTTTGPAGIDTLVTLRSGRFLRAAPRTPLAPSASRIANPKVARSANLAST